MSRLWPVLTLWGHAVSIGLVCFERGEMERYLGDAGFMLTEVVERPPYPEEVAAPRVYMRALQVIGGRRSCSRSPTARRP
ncbi:MAG TPA: hypothetical protein VKA84_27345 [Gemmatimonadaceae bacterium]|nr:hypothetical protein [Gemmatimonadaceae bacterium]